MDTTNSNILTANALKLVKNKAVNEYARENFIGFAKKIKGNDMKLTQFHVVYYMILDMFAKGIIKKLIVTVPPQHGKSEGSSRLLPSFMLGRNPNLKVAIGSYSAGLSKDFNLDCQRIIDSPDYYDLFPETRLNGSKKVRTANGYQRNSTMFEIVNKKGSLRAVGRGGSLTGKTVDVSILDDVYRDYAEGNSPVIREQAWKWYTTVVRKRLHNNSQELIVFTRWHMDDLIGRIEKAEKVVTIEKWEDIFSVPEGAWLKINFEAIKTGSETEIDPRAKDTALWEDRHSLKKLIAERELDPIQFELLNQGHAGNMEGRLYRPFKTYTSIEDWAQQRGAVLVGKNNYTDCADDGEDYLCSACYDKYKIPGKGGDKDEFYCLITDVVYTDKPIQETTESVPMMLVRNQTRLAWIESNNGGKAFAFIIKPKVRPCRVEDFWQGGNKESRVITNAGLVNSHIILPFDCETRFPAFYNDLTTFLRKFEANAHDDAPDCLTGIIEKEVIQTTNTKGVVRKN